MTDDATPQKDLTPTPPTASSTIEGAHPLLDPSDAPVKTEGSHLDAGDVAGPPLPEASDEAVRHYMSDTLTLPEILNAISVAGTQVEIDPSGNHVKVKRAISPGRYVYGAGRTVAEAVFDVLVQLGVKQRAE